MRQTFTLLLAAMVTVAGALHAAAPAASNERLRRLVSLPRLNFVLGMGLDPWRGFALTPDRVTTLQAVETTRKAMQGDGSDAPRYTRIGRLLDAIGSHHEARQNYAQAVEFYRQQGLEQSDDGALLADFGAALQGLGNLDEAERVLQRAVQVAPNHWMTHAALGRLRTTQAFTAIAPRAGSGSTDSSDNWASLFARVSSRPKLTPAQADQAQKRIEEAVACYDRAIALGPDDPEPYTGRAALRALQSVLNWVLDPGTRLEPESLGLAKAMYPPDVLPDLRQAAQLAPKNPQAVGAALLYELFSTALERGASELGLFGTSEAWASLPESLRRSVRQALAQLEEMGQTYEALPAAAALEMRGSLQCFVVNDLTGAERTLRRAVALDPKRTQAWETLVFILASTKRAEALLDLCQARLREEDTARARLLLAKAWELLPDWGRVLQTTEALQRRYPEDLYANLALAAALVRSSDHEAVLGRAIQLLAKAEKLAGSSPSREQVINLLFSRGLMFGLAGQIASARHQLGQVKELDSDHPGLQEALEILDQL